MDTDHSAQYLFISYAHKDAGKVLPVIRALQSRKVRLWFDEGIEVGTNWPKVVAENLKNSGAVVVFLSKNAIASQNCSREIHYAVAEKKRMMTVRLDDAVLPEDLAMQLSVVPGLSCSSAEETSEAIRGQLDETFYGEHEGSAKRLKKRKKAVNPWAVLSVILAAALLGAGAFFAGTLLGWFGKKPVIRSYTVEDGEGEEPKDVSVTEFASPFAMEILLRSLRTEAVYLFGNHLISDVSAIHHDRDGWKIEGRPIERGMFSDLTLLSGQGVTALAVVYESLTDLNGIGAFTELTYLDLSGNDLTDLHALAALKNLEKIQILDLPAEADLSGLANCPALKEVVVGFEMRDRVEALLDAGIRVVIGR